MPKSTSKNADRSCSPFRKNSLWRKKKLEGHMPKEQGLLYRLDDMIEISPKSPQHTKRQIQLMQISWYSLQLFLESYLEGWGCSDVILKKLHERVLRCGTEWQKRNREFQKQPTINHFHMHQEPEQCNLAFLYHDRNSGQSSYVTELNLKNKTHL